MAEGQRVGAVHWIDHYGVPINDLDRWIAFYQNVLGASEEFGLGGGEMRRQGVGGFVRIGRAYAGGFKQRKPIPPSNGLGQGMPRYGYFIRQADVDDHLRRLDKFQAPHTEPARCSHEGDEGTVIYFQDPDENQMEFWAPDRLPDGAMDGAVELGVGRLASAVLESRDLKRTTEFYSRYFAVDPISSANLDKDTAAFQLATGGRMVFKEVSALSKRTAAWNLRGAHTALTVREDEFLLAYERMWNDLPEWRDDDSDDPADPATLPARTHLSGKLFGGKLYQAGGQKTNSAPSAWGGRSDNFFDWDANYFHFVGGVPDGDTMTNYRAIYMEDRVLEEKAAGERA
ncbi:MAG: hypothetical protein HW416_1396 [Chloroflexi bacterium]|nr:hypothetical protein [Chloroflexota bacterium]